MVTVITTSSIHPSSDVRTPPVFQQPLDQCTSNPNISLQIPPPAFDPSSQCPMVSLWVLRLVKPCEMPLLVLDYVGVIKLKDGAS